MTEQITHIACQAWITPFDLRRHSIAMECAQANGTHAKIVITHSHKLMFDFNVQDQTICQLINQKLQKVFKRAAQGFERPALIVLDEMAESFAGSNKIINPDATHALMSQALRVFPSLHWESSRVKASNRGVYYGYSHFGGVGQYAPPKHLASVYAYFTHHLEACVHVKKSSGFFVVLDAFEVCGDTHYAWKITEVVSGEGEKDFARFQREPDAAAALDAGLICMLHAHAEGAEVAQTLYRLRAKPPSGPRVSGSLAEAIKSNKERAESRRAFEEGKHDPTA